MVFWIVDHTKAKKGQEIERFIDNIAVYSNYARDLLSITINVIFIVAVSWNILVSR